MWYSRSSLVLILALEVGANFNPEVGFVRRRDIRRNDGQVWFSPARAASPGYAN